MHESIALSDVVDDEATATEHTSNEQNEHMRPTLIIYSGWKKSNSKMFPKGSRVQRKRISLLIYNKIIFVRLSLQSIHSYKWNEEKWFRRVSIGLYVLNAQAWEHRVYSCFVLNVNGPRMSQMGASTTRTHTATAQPKPKKAENNEGKKHIVNEKCKIIFVQSLIYDCRKGKWLSTILGLLVYVFISLPST